MLLLVCDCYMLNVRHFSLLLSPRAGAPLSDALTTTTTTSSSSSSSTSAALQRYFTKRAEVLEVVPTVFADAAEEYASLESVKSRLEDWKAAYPRDYQNAYVPESAPALFAPFVRLQLLRWDPLHGQGQGQSQHQVARSFDQQDWYGQLFEYGMAGQDAAAAAAAADDPDANLVPQLVESLVLPQAMHLVKHCWDPFDFDQSRAVTALLTDLFVYVPADKADMGQLTSLTVTRLEEAVAAAAVPPWPAAAAAASPLAAAVQQWCFVRAVQVLRALMGLKELLSQSVLVKLGVTGLLTKQLLPCLRGSTQELTLAVARAEAVISSIPEAWFPERGGWPEAQPLLDWLASLASTLESQPVNSSTGLTNRALTSRLAGVLQRVKLQDRARQLEARAAAAAAGGGGGR
jgi:GC-rich sequence DNA-binding factor